MAEIAEAVEIINVAFDGIEVGLKVGSAGAKVIKALAALINWKLSREKLEGKTSMTKLLKKGGDLQVFKFDEGQLKKYEKYAKKYGILYTKLPDINKEDKMTEVLFHTDSLPRVIALQEKLKMGTVTSMEDYIANGKEEEVEKLIGELEGKNSQNLTEAKTKISEERSEELREVAERVDVVAMSKDESKIGITIDNKLIYNETEDRILTRIPRQENEYLELKGEDVKVINDGKTRLTFLDKDKEYDILDKDGKPVKKMTGRQIFERSYDPVSDETIKKAGTRKQGKEKSKSKDKSTAVKRAARR